MLTLEEFNALPTWKRVMIGLGTAAVAFFILEIVLCLIAIALPFVLVYLAFNSKLLGFFIDEERDCTCKGEDEECIDCNGTGTFID